jgi:hypothetical protein
MLIVKMRLALAWVLGAPELFEPNENEIQRGIGFRRDEGSSLAHELVLLPQKVWVVLPPRVVGLG